MIMFGKIFKIITNTILGILIVIGILSVLSLLPIPGNYKIFTVQSGSMEPAIHTGSLIFSKPLADYNVGDVVTRKTDDPKMTVTHRIVSKEEVDGKTVFATQGDANNAPDGEKFSKELIVGKTFLTIPYLGYLVGFAKTQLGLLIFVVIPATIIIYEEITKIKKEIRRLVDKRRSRKATVEDEGHDPLAPDTQFVRKATIEKVKKMEIL
jgi:signal peptidase I